MQTKDFNEIEINGILYSGKYTLEEIRSKLAPDEWHLSNLEGYNIEIMYVLKYDESDNSWTKLCQWSKQLDKDLILEIESKLR